MLFNPGQYINSKLIRLCEYLGLVTDTVFTMSLEPAQKYRFTPPLWSSKQPKTLFAANEYHLKIDDECVITIYWINSVF